MRAGSQARPASRLGTNLPTLPNSTKPLGDDAKSVLLQIQATIVPVGPTRPADRESNELMLAGMLSHLGELVREAEGGASV